MGPQTGSFSTASACCGSLLCIVIAAQIWVWPHGPLNGLHSILIFACAAADNPVSDGSVLSWARNHSDASLASAIRSFSASRFPSEVW